MESPGCHIWQKEEVRDLPRRETPRRARLPKRAVRGAPACERSNRLAVGQKVRSVVRGGGGWGVLELWWEGVQG